MHIVHLIARLNDGGPARVVAALAQAMQVRGHRVTVLTGQCEADEPDLSSMIAASGVDVVPIATLGRRVQAGQDLRTLADLVRRIRQLKPSVVHTHTAKAGTLGRLACRWLQVPCLHTYHGHVMDGYFGRISTLAIRVLERLVAGTAHHQALTMSQWDDLSRRFCIGRPGRWHCLPIPVAVPARAPAPWQAGLVKRLPVIGFLGRFAPVKDPMLWLETLAWMAKHTPVQGLMCGDGALKAACEVRAAALGLSVSFTGFVPAGEALAACDVLLMTSRNEGLPLVAIEAGGLGIPVVAPLVGGLQDLIKAGAVLGAVRSAPALAKACLGVIGDASLRTRLTTVARDCALSLAPTALAPRYEALYRAIDRGGT